MTTSTKTIDATQLGMAVDGALSIPMSRRRVLRLLGTAGAVALFTGVAQVTPAGAGPSAGSYVTTSDLNLRAKPKSTAKVLLVMPHGANVEEIGGRKNGYLKVRYNGKAGWAFEEFLRAPIKPNMPTLTGVRTTTTDVNLRSGPSTSNEVLRVLDPGTKVASSDEVVDGFRYVDHLGTTGWVWDAFLGAGGASAGPDKLTTTSDLNHRAKASTSAKVLSVIPAGATVGDQGESSNGFRKVSYGGTIGWCSEAYLA